MAFTAQGTWKLVSEGEGGVRPHSGGDHRLGDPSPSRFNPFSYLNRNDLPPRKRLFAIVRGFDLLKVLKIIFYYSN